jgi:hypothetical protein
MVGYRAGDSITTGKNNTGLGMGVAFDIDADNQIAIGKEATCTAANQIKLGNSSVTSCYIGGGAVSDVSTNTEGADVYAKSGYFRRLLAYNVGNDETSGLTIHAHCSDDLSGNGGINLNFKMSADDTNSGGETARISSVSRSGNMNSSLSGFGTELVFWNRVAGTLTKQMYLQGGDGHQALWILGNAASRYALNVINDGDNANRYGIDIDAGADDASGTTHYLNCNDGNGDQVGHISNTSGTFALTDVSDERLKKNIVDTSVKGVETIDKMKVRDFEWIKSGDKTTAGFVAQELAEAFPSAVTGEDGAMEDILDEDGNKTGERIKPMGVSRDVLVPVLIKAVQELSARVKELEGK